MRRVKHSVRALLFTITLLASFVVSSGTASAASDYDDMLHVTPTLSVYTDGSAKTQKMDISQTWWAEFKQTYAKRVAQNIGWPTNFVTEFENVVSSGGSWGVFMETTQHGNVMHIVATHDPNAYCGFVGSANTGAYECASNPGYGFMYAGYFTHNSYGGNGCFGSYGDRCSDNGMNIYTSPTVHSGTAGYTFVSIPSSTLLNYKFFYMNFALSYPPGYEGELIPTEPPPAKYVAMGDSFSSGEGAAPFEAGTDAGGVNECHRSMRAYPRLLQNDLDLGSAAFLACSGATTANITGGQWNEPAQIDALSNETENVTISIGGNDAGVVYYALSCAVACGPGTPVYNAMMDNINQPAFKANLVYTFEEILEAAPNANLYVADYPYLADENATTCQGLDFSGMHDVQTALNKVIFDAVIEVGLNSSRIFMVQTNYPGSPFEGGHLCNGGDSLFHGVVAPPNLEYSLHPNTNGQAAYATVFAEAIG